MMKKRIVLQLLTLLLCCGALPVAFSNNLTDPPSDESQSCAVPPPTNVHATAVTPTTISLAWTDATPATQNYYKVQGVNLNTGLPIPDVYTSGENTTITGLTPNNCYSFKVSASVCPTGPYGKPSLPGEGCTGYIVIDIIAEYNAPSGNGESYPINTDPIPLCMPRSSTNGHSAPFDNPAVCQLTYNGLNLRFGLALTPGNENNVPIDFIPINGSGPDPNFNFSYRDPEHRIVWLQYGPSPVLEVKYISVVDPGGLAFAHLEAKILNTAGVSAFTEWDYNCGPTNFQQGNTPTQALAQGLKGTPSAQQRSAGFTVKTIAPNPFSHAVSCSYELAAAGPVDIALFDAYGSLVKIVQAGSLQEAGSYQVQITGEKLPNGLYFLKIQTPEQQQVFPLVKQE